MPREAAAVRVYTVCDESKYLIVRNVPSLGCGDELANLFATYGPVEECTPMDAEDCEPYTDVFFIKFSHVSNARFAKRKLDKSVFLGNRLQHLLEDLKGYLIILQDYFPSKSMNATAKLVREKLDKGASSWSSSHHDPRRGPLDPALLLAAGGGAAVAVVATPRTAKAASGGVALQGLAKTMQRDLNAVAAKVDTTKKRRYKFMLTGNASSNPKILAAVCC
ncbi:hypothetical protein E2562_026152 [Oryza meyeriana var. granulata]|uniref:RNA-binding protein 48 n=1 Tax=Oryza meyeriana var. granulata TaxID=110450 RepID=A0A6G1E269_9ORYZ|nr:hypothetical protein E2562_026152 [Oryza meyeriana var. granulata]